VDYHRLVQRDDPVTIAPAAEGPAVTSEPGWERSGRPRYRAIESYGLIGDLHTAALVGRDGSIDWFCPGRFDAPSLFAEILDAEHGGSFRIAPTHTASSKQLYLPDTAILLTRFYTETGVAEVTDFMPAHLTPCAVIRRVDAVRGVVDFRMACRPAFDYARAGHRLRLDGPRLARFIADDGRATELHGSVPMSEGGGGAATCRFTLRAGQRAWFALQPVDGGARWSEEAVSLALDRTRRFWRRWLARSIYRGRWREMVLRSAITLKLCTYAPTGAVVSAPTTSLPEAVGGHRNWDYRYAWLRDSAFTAFAFQRLGFYDEAAQFADWLGERCKEDPDDPQLQIVYAVDGSGKLEEEELTHLDGYRGSRPVRIGNGAWNQLQLDVYGELMDAVYLSNKQEPISWDLWQSVRRLLDWLAENWQRPDEGIWEVRGGRRHFVYSRLMCWVAFERAMRMQLQRGLPGDRLTWRRCRDEIYEEIMARGWSPKRRAFVQYYDGDVLDASNLLMPLVKFIGPRDPRMLSTLEAIQRDLVSDSLVYRYDPRRASDDGLGGAEEGSFSLCSFWLVECLTRAGQLDEARLIFEKMLTYASNLGLFAEQVGDTGEALGNYPQAFTHLGLISAAWDLDRALGGEE
jgi:GH15 family glucan-1,4-alpha-glucosidase